LQGIFLELEAFSGTLFTAFSCILLFSVLVVTIPTLVFKVKGLFLMHTPPFLLLHAWFLIITAQGVCLPAI
jgi:hypothetical protein